MICPETQSFEYRKEGLSLFLYRSLVGQAAAWIVLSENQKVNDIDLKFWSFPTPYTGIVKRVKTS